MKQLISIATSLDKAAIDAQATEQFSQKNSFSLDDAYTIQAISIDRRLERGEQLVGYKLGFTSKAKMEQMGVHDIIWGRLTDAMTVSEGGELLRDQYIHPRAEPEIAFRLKKDISHQIQLDEVLDYIGAVAPALEVIDSRYQNFKFSLEDVVADNCSSTAYVVGPWLSADTNVADLEIDLIINGEVAQNGNSNAILGNPLAALVELSKMMERYKVTAKAGQLILAGAATSAVHLHTGDTVEGHFSGLGKIGFTVK